jgi:hypothetical protein
MILDAVLEMKSIDDDPHNKLEKMLGWSGGVKPCQVWCMTGSVLSLGLSREERSELITI